MEDEEDDMRLKEWFQGKPVRAPVRGKTRQFGFTTTAEDGVVEFRKVLKKEHFLISPPGICNDVDVINYVDEDRHAKRVVCYYKRHYYSASINAIRGGRLIIDRGYNRQFFLHIKQWKVDGREAGEIQPPLLTLADKAPSSGPPPAPRPEADESAWQDREDLQ